MPIDQSIMGNRRSFLKNVLLGASVFSVYSCKTLKSKHVLPKILILGDSISIGYTPFVQESLKGVASVTRPYQENGKPENCQGTTNGLANIDRWLGGEKWDIIHFNFGLHDLKHVKKETGENSNDKNDPYQAAPEQYEENLKVIVKQLMATDAKLIFATTTPYPDEGLKPLRDPKHYKEYNRRAARVMDENNIVINDLERFAASQLGAIQIPQNVHFTEEGSEVLAGEVVRHLKVVMTKI